MLSICLAHVESQNKRATSGGSDGGSSSLLYIHIGSETRGDCRLYFPPLLQPVFPQPPRRVFVFFSPIARVVLSLSLFALAFVRRLFGNLRIRLFSRVLPINVALILFKYRRDSVKP